jgi:hypothetical protein
VHDPQTLDQTVTPEGARPGGASQNLIDPLAEPDKFPKFAVDQRIRATLAAG